VRRLTAAFGILASVCPVLSATAADEAGRPLLPASIPGCELRVLDERKSILFNVKGTWVEASVPVFFYCPVGGRPEAARRIRQVRDDLRALGQKPEWSAEDYRRVISEVDAALQAVESAPGAQP
jgi:hypothetical protein